MNNPGDRSKARETRFVPVKSAQAQAALLGHKARDFLVRQLTQVIVTPKACFQHDAIRAHMGDWLNRMLDRKPVKVVAVALANRMARTIWALIRRGDSYKAALS